MIKDSHGESLGCRRRAKSGRAKDASPADNPGEGEVTTSSLWGLERGEHAAATTTTASAQCSHFATQHDALLMQRVHRVIDQYCIQVLLIGPGLSTGPLSEYFARHELGGAELA